MLSLFASSRLCCTQLHDNEYEYQVIDIIGCLCIRQRLCALIAVWLKYSKISGDGV